MSIDLFGRPSSTSIYVFGPCMSLHGCELDNSEEVAESSVVTYGYATHLVDVVEKCPTVSAALAPPFFVR